LRERARATTPGRTCTKRGSQPNTQSASACELRTKFPSPESETAPNSRLKRRTTVAHDAYPHICPKLLRQRCPMRQKRRVGTEWFRIRSRQEVQQCWPLPCRQPQVKSLPDATAWCILAVAGKRMLGHQFRPAAARPTAAMTAPGRDLRFVRFKAPLASRHGVPNS
jgi:hypothetical protein